MLGERTMGTVVTLVAVAGLLLGCTSTTTPSPSVTPSPSLRAAAPPDTGSELVGTWSITDVADGGTSTLTLQEGGWWEVQHECGPVGGSWAALGDYFMATAWSGTTACISGGDPRPTLPWVENTYRIAASGSGWTLRDTTGEETATLSNGVWDGTAPAITVIRPLPQGYAIGELQGRWVPLVSTPGDSYVEFRDVAWVSSDGCNGNGGKWADLGDGYFFSTPAGPQTAIGCANVPVADWVSAARTAGFDGEELVLFDAAGDELGRLSRS